MKKLNNISIVLTLTAALCAGTFAQGGAGGDGGGGGSCGGAGNSCGGGAGGAGGDGRLAALVFVQDGNGSDGGPSRHCESSAQELAYAIAQGGKGGDGGKGGKCGGAGNRCSGGKGGKGGSSGGKKKGFFMNHEISWPPTGDIADGLYGYAMAFGGDGEKGGDGGKGGDGFAMINDKGNATSNTDAWAPREWCWEPIVLPSLAFAQGKEGHCPGENNRCGPGKDSPGGRGGSGGRCPGKDNDCSGGDAGPRSNGGKGGDCGGRKNDCSGGDGGLAAVILDAHECKHGLGSCCYCDTVPGDPFPDWPNDRPKPKRSA